MNGNAYNTLEFFTCINLKNFTLSHHTYSMNSHQKYKCVKCAHKKPMREKKRMKNTEFVFESSVEKRQQEQRQCIVNFQ